jgi:hypothetical protein
MVPAVAGAVYPYLRTGKGPYQAGQIISVKMRRFTVC